MLCVFKCGSARLCHASRPIIYEYASHPLLKCFQRRSYASDLKINEEQSLNCAEKKTSRDTGPFKLLAQWKWVVRGNYKVAAFSTNNNPAIAIDHKTDQYWHSHRCPNCQTVYEHTHPYGSLHHPQHIKDCPKCKVLAPADLKIGNQIQ